MLRILLLVASVSFLLSGADAGRGWDYNDKGRDWRTGYCQKGRRQSPVALSLQEAVYDSKLPAFNFNYATEMVQTEYFNNGQSVGFTLVGNSTKSSKISGGGLLRREEYFLHGLLFHWGLGDCDGAEHVIDYERSQLELQLVHFNAKYGSFESAKIKSNGLAIISILFNVKDKPTSNLGKFLSQEFGTLLDNLKTPLTKINATVNATRYIEDFAISNSFFRYIGSLTAPGCEESVTWSIMTQRLDIDRNLLAKFRAVQLQNTNGTATVSANYRAVQKLNGRTVYSNDRTARGGVSRLTGSTADILLSQLLLGMIFSCKKFYF